MKKNIIIASFVVGTSILAAGSAFAQETLVLPDSPSQTTEITATVSEQAYVTVPAAVAFDVTNIADATVAEGVSVDVSNIVLASATKQLKVSIQAAAANFTPSVVDAATWSANQISWNASSWTSGTGATGVLSATSFAEVATCAADSAACGTDDLVFTLDANTDVKRSGDHTLELTWKFESIDGE